MVLQVLGEGDVGVESFQPFAGQVVHCAVGAHFQQGLVDFLEQIRISFGYPEAHLAARDVHSSAEAFSFLDERLDADFADGVVCDEAVAFSLEDRLHAIRHGVVFHAVRPELVVDQSVHQSAPFDHCYLLSVKVAERIARLQLERHEFFLESRNRETAVHDGRVLPVAAEDHIRLLFPHPFHGVVPFHELQVQIDLHAVGELRDGFDVISVGYVLVVVEIGEGLVVHVPDDAQRFFERVFRVNGHFRFHSLFRLCKAHGQNDGRCYCY